MRPNLVRYGLLSLALLGGLPVIGAPRAATAQASAAYPWGWWSGWPPKAAPIVVVPVSLSGPSVVEAEEATLPSATGPDLPEGEFLVEIVVDPEGRTVAAQLLRASSTLGDAAVHHLLAPFLHRRYGKTVVFGAPAYVCLATSVRTAYE